MNEENALEYFQYLYTGFLPLLIKITLVGKKPVYNIVCCELGNNGEVVKLCFTGSPLCEFHLFSFTM